MTEQIDFGTWFKNELRKQGITQWDFANMVYVDQSVVSKWSCGARIPKFSEMQNILCALGYHIEFVKNEA